MPHQIHSCKLRISFRKGKEPSAPRKIGIGMMIAN
jgi:hypothetical protein